MKYFACTILFFVCTISLFSCSMVKGKGEAEKVAEAQFNDRMQNGWAGTNKYYSKLFWKNTSEKKWQNLEKLVSKAMGKPESYSLSNWNIQSKVNTNELSGTIVTLVYDVEYEKGKGAERLVLHKPLMGDEYSIIAHNFNSELIQELINKGIEQAASADGV
jgi:hypothetical protein